LWLKHVSPFKICWNFSHKKNSEDEGWYLTSKFPIFDDDGELTAIVVVSQDLETPVDSDLELGKLKPLLEYIQHNLGKPMKKEDLAKRIGLSPRQLDRRMNRAFRLSTKKYIMKCRLDYAIKLMINTEQTLSDIALSCGFSELSAFTRQFVASTNQTPSNFRKAHINSKSIIPIRYILLGFCSLLRNYCIFTYILLL
jgi:AraC-like DNA-binding protein